jgi:phage host-nuclease inhibitor protein Gam
MSRTILALCAGLLVAQPAAANFLTYAEWARMKPDMRAIYIAGAFDALITFAMNDEQRAVNAHYNNCIAQSKMTVAQLAENVRKYAKGKPNLQDFVETPLINYLYEFCGAPPRGN